MSPFDRDTSRHADSPQGAPRDGSAASASNSDAEDSAAHIADLVRRTSERDAGPEPSTVAPTEVTMVEPPAATPADAPRATGSSAAASTPRVRPARRQPSLRVLVAGGAIAALLIAGGFALSRTNGSDAVRPPTTAAPAPAAAAAAPAGYSEQVTDEITDCADHSHGRTKISFRKHNCVQARRALGSGQVDGRPVLFVVARIEMKSSEAATSVKHVLDGIGTGNLNDLLREGKTFPGAPQSMPDSGYASVQSGSVVLVTEAGFADRGSSSSDDPALRGAARKVAVELAAQS